MAQTSETKPVLVTSWQTDALDTGAIHDELNRLWASIGGPRHGGDAPGEQVAESRPGGGELMRANTLNLIAVADSRKHAHLITDTVSRLRDFLPSRTIIFITERNESQEHTWDVHVQLNETQHGDDAPPIRFETITITADPAVSGHLASLVAPLLVSELPTFLWWPSGDFSNSLIFQDLVEVVDRLIVDSAQLGADATAVAHLRSLLDDEDDPWVGDFTWLRLAPWRQLIAQFFDPPDVQRCLDHITQVNIAYAQTRRDHSSGFAAALLTVGWLASRLGWEFVEPLEKRRTGGWTAPLRSTNGDRTRDIQLRLLPDTSPEAVFSLRRVEIIAVGDAEGIFRIERTDMDDLITSSETTDAPFVSRMVYSRRPEAVEMLGDELQRFGPDRIFEDAIRFATHLLP
jgi:glucose-6-phosphate dehydrogenase assembly protein OpcA